MLKEKEEKKEEKKHVHKSSSLMRSFRWPSLRVYACALSKYSPLCYEVLDYFKMLFTNDKY